MQRCAENQQDAKYYVLLIRRHLFIPHSVSFECKRLISPEYAIIYHSVAQLYRDEKMKYINECQGEILRYNKSSTKKNSDNE